MRLDSVYVVDTTDVDIDNLVWGNRCVTYIIDNFMCKDRCAIKFCVSE